MREQRPVEYGPLFLPVLLTRQYSISVYFGGKNQETSESRTSCTMRSSMMERRC